MTQNSLSFLVSDVCATQIRTPTVLNASATNIISSAGSPAARVYLISTAAPTSTNNITSAASHSFPNFCESLPDTDSGHLSFRTHAIATTARSPDTDTFPSSHPSIAISRNENPSTMMTFMLFLTQCFLAYDVSKNR